MSDEKHLPAVSSVVLSVCLCCVYAVTCKEEGSLPLPDGLVLVEDFVSPEEEALLLAAIDWSGTNDDVTGEVLLVCVWFLLNS